MYERQPTERVAERHAQRREAQHVGIRPGTEWATFYRELAAAYDLRIDALGPDFGTEALMEEIAGSAGLATLVGSGDRYVWPTAYDLRRIPLAGPAPVYPHTLLFRTGNPHPTLTRLRRHLGGSWAGGRSRRELVATRQSGAERPGEKP